MQSGDAKETVSYAPAKADRTKSNNLFPKQWFTFGACLR